MSNDEIFNELKKEFTARAEKQPAILRVLVDREWHCRHEYAHADSDQAAGGGGIQGLERGTKKRPGFVIETENKYCEECGEREHDRWIGERKEPNPAANIPASAAKRIYQYYDYRDAIQQRERKPQDLVIDHRVPMERWGQAEESIPKDISKEKIQRKFQLLKNDGDGNHNLLKSRACEKCIESEIRGTPFGIKFWYEGGPEWPDDVPKKGPEAEKGCVGCGWYNFDKWRKELVSLIEDHSDFDSVIEIDLEELGFESRGGEQAGLEDFTG